jgi:ABC-type branched-subunit amino acid transport system substrate-binding protein
MARRIAAALLLSFAASAVMAEDVKIGVIAPFTGPAAGFGKQIEAGCVRT